MTAPELSIGLLVEHEKWGPGKVIRLDPNVQSFMWTVAGIPNRKQR